MRVCIMGLGYIGFPTACVLGQAGHDVIGVDVNPVLVDRLSLGDIPIVNEPGLTDLAHSVLQSGKLKISTEPEVADVFIIAVPTPVQDDREVASPEHSRLEYRYRADLSYVVAATKAIAPFLRAGNLLILESTVPPHTLDRTVLPLLQSEGVDTSTVLLAHAPERVLPGNILRELVYNHRLVGGLTPQASRAAADFYRSFVKAQVEETDCTTAELVKLMENTYRDVNIALANEFALVGEHLGVDIWNAIRLANLHPRVNYLRPGPGVGGHCIAVDPYFVIEAAPELTSLIQAARRVNRQMPLHVLDLFRRLAQGTVVRKAAILGASYKANVGDERESPALEVARLLESEGINVAIHDPHIGRYAHPVERVLAGADAVLLLTDHVDYLALDPRVVSGLVSQRLLLDTRGYLDAASWTAAGFRVATVGSGQYNMRGITPETLTVGD
ncbi:MAG: nucleotide sugar dehydrogenase [Bacillota bacterium]